MYGHGQRKFVRYLLVVEFTKARRGWWQTLVVSKTLKDRIV